MGPRTRKTLGKNLNYAGHMAIMVGILCTFPLGPNNALQAAPAPWEDPVPRRAAEVTIEISQVMDFGTLADKSGSVTLGLEDSITSDLDILVFGGSPYSGIYTINGDPDTIVDIAITSIPSNGFSLGSFVTSEGVGSPISATLDGSGQLVLTVGATLALNAAQVSVGGGQTISFTITSTYN